MNKEEIYQEAIKLIEQLRNTTHTQFHTCRWNRHICEEIAAIVNSRIFDFTCSVSYPPFLGNHCRVFTFVER